MRVQLSSVPWYSGKPTEELNEACELLADGTWRDAAIDFYALREARRKRGLSAPKGMQAELNRVIAAKFAAEGWTGNDGRFVKGRTWVRVTFRHQMSLGADILDAARLCAKERLGQAAILAGESEWLRLVSPNDYAALVSFEKLRIAVAALDGVISTPLLIGALRGESELPTEISASLRAARPRDRTVPDQSHGADT